MGIITKRNIVANKKLKKQYEEAGIEQCEIGFDGCWRNNALGFVHKHKRIWYRACPDLLYAMSETLLGCTPCHQKLEFDEKLTLETFKRLRPKQKSMTTNKKPISKREEKRSKKPDWMREHKCKHCHKILTGLLCSCGQLSV